MTRVIEHLPLGHISSVMTQFFFFFFLGGGGGVGGDELWLSDSSLLQGRLFRVDGPMVEGWVPHFSIRFRVKFRALDFG